MPSSRCLSRRRLQHRARHVPGHAPVHGAAERSPSRGGSLQVPRAAPVSRFAPHRHGRSRPRHGPSRPSVRPSGQDSDSTLPREAACPAVDTAELIGERLESRRGSPVRHRAGPVPTATAARAAWVCTWRALPSRLVHNGHRQSEERRRLLEVAGFGSEHRRKDVEDVGAALDEPEPGFERPSARLEATRAHEDPIREICRLMTATRSPARALRRRSGQRPRTDLRDEPIAARAIFPRHFASALLWRSAYSSSRSMALSSAGRRPSWKRTSTRQPSGHARSSSRSASRQRRSTRSAISRRRATARGPAETMCNACSDSTRARTSPDFSATSTFCSASEPSVGTLAKSDESMITWLCRRDRRTVSSPTLSKGVAAEVEQDSAGVAIGDATHDKGRIGE